MTSSASANPGRASLVRIGGSIGVAGNCIGWAVFLGLCAGFGALANFGFLPLVLGIVGLVLTVYGAITQKHVDVETHVLAGIFINLFSIIGGLFQTAIMLHWTIMPK